MTPADLVALAGILDWLTLIVGLVGIGFTIHVTAKRKMWVLMALVLAAGGLFIFVQVLVIIKFQGVIG